MIRDIIIVNNAGILLFHKAFGDCHSIGDKLDLVSSFISAIQMFSQEIYNDDIKVLDMVDKKLAIHRNSSLTYIIVYDFTDDVSEIKFKLGRIEEIFEEKYKKPLSNFSGQVSLFENFGNLLIEMNVEKSNCGGSTVCKGCPHQSKSLPIIDFIENINKQELYKKHIRKLTKKK